MLVSTTDITVHTITAVSPDHLIITITRSSSFPPVSWLLSTAAAAASQISDYQSLNEVTQHSLYSVSSSEILTFQNSVWSLDNMNTPLTHSTLISEYSALISLLLLLWHYYGSDQHMCNSGLLSLQTPLMCHVLCVSVNCDIIPTKTPQSLNLI